MRPSATLLASFLALGALASTGVQAARSERIAVAVTDLRDDGAGEELTRALTDLLVIELSRFPDVEVTSYEDVRAVLRHSANQQLLGCASEECMVDVGRALDVTHLVHGSIALDGEVPRLTVSLLHVETAQARARTTQLLQGRGEDLVAALKAASINLLAPVLSGASEEGRVTPAMLKTLKSARRPKPFTLGGSVAASLLFATTATPTLPSAPLLSGGGHAEFAFLTPLSVRVAVGVAYQRATSDGFILIANNTTSDVLLTTTRSDAEVVAAHGALGLMLRPDDGLVLPFVRADVGGAFLSVALGDVIPQREDLPAFFAQEREGGSGPALYGSVGVGVDILALDPVAIRLELSIFDYAHLLERRVYAAGQNKAEAALLEEGPIENLLGAQLSLGVLFQG